MFLLELSPINADNRSPPSMKSSVKKTHMNFTYKSAYNFKVLANCEFSIYHKIILW